MPRLQICVLLATIAIGYHESLAAFLDVWQRRDMYSHGPLIAVVSLVLAGRALWHEDAAPAKSSWIGVAIVLSSMSLWFVARAATVEVVELAAIVPLVWGVAGVVYGLDGMKRTAVPLALMVWALPVWDALAGVAQAATVWAVSELLWVSGVTAVVEGSTVVLAVGQFGIEHGCSGIHYLIVATALGMIYAYLFVAGWMRRTLCVAASLLFAVLMNWVRVYSIVIAGYLTDMQHYLVTVDHYWYGWGLFLVMLPPLFYVFRVLERRTPGDSGGRRPMPRRETRAAPAYVPAVVALTLLIAGPATFAYASARLAGDVAVEAVLPERLDGWTREAVVPPVWDPRFGHPDAAARAAYGNGSRTIFAYKNIYLEQRQGAELIAGDNRFYPREFAVTSRAAVELGDSGALANAAVYDRGGERFLLVYGYLVGERFIADARQVKLLQVSRFLRGLPGGGTVAVSARCRMDCADERETLTRLLRALVDAEPAGSRERRHRDDR